MTATLHQIVSAVRDANPPTPTALFLALKKFDMADVNHSCQITHTTAMHIIAEAEVKLPGGRVTGVGVAKLTAPYNEAIQRAFGNAVLNVFDQIGLAVNYFADPD